MAQSAFSSSSICHKIASIGPAAQMDELDEIQGLDLMQGNAKAGGVCT